MSDNENKDIGNENIAVKVFISAIVIFLFSIFILIWGFDSGYFTFEKSDNTTMQPPIENINHGELILHKIEKPLKHSECVKNRKSLGIRVCIRRPDYWAAAVKLCGGINRMAGDKDLNLLVKKIYGIDLGNNHYIYNAQKHALGMMLENGQINYNFERNNEVFEHYFGENDKVYNVFSSTCDENTVMGGTYHQYVNVYEFGRKDENGDIFSSLGSTYHRYNRDKKEMYVFCIN